MRYKETGTGTHMETQRETQRHTMKWKAKPMMRFIITTCSPLHVSVNFQLSCCVILRIGETPRQIECKTSRCLQQQTGTADRDNRHRQAHTWELSHSMA